MLAEIAAANAAFAVIKTAIQNGREIADVAHKVGDYVNATESLRKKGEKRKRRGDTDLEEFMHLEKLKQQEEQLKQWMIWAGRPNLWSDWQKFQAEARKRRLAAIEARRRRVQQWIEIGTVATLIIFGLVGLALLVWWALYLKTTL
jgi:hypothetical protein